MSQFAAINSVLLKWTGCIRLHKTTKVCANQKTCSKQQLIYIILKQVKMTSANETIVPP